MKLITRDTDYGIRALIFMGRQQKKVISVAELVKALKMPRPFLRKILQKLNKSGVLNSYKGQGGGFSLTSGAGRVSLKDLMEIFQGAIVLNECIFKKKACPKRHSCPLKKKIDSIEEEVVLRLGFINIQDLLKKKGG